MMIDGQKRNTRQINVGLPWDDTRDIYNNVIIHITFYQSGSKNFRQKVFRWKEILYNYTMKSTTKLKIRRKNFHETLLLTTV